MSQPATSTKSSMARSTAPSARPPLSPRSTSPPTATSSSSNPCQVPTMTHTVCVKLAPVLTAERWDDPKWMRPDRVFYWPGSLKLIPRQPTPIVRDHDMDDVIGTVTELFTMPFTDGEWIVARGVIDDPPSWLRQYRTKASVGYWNVHSTPHINGSTRITSALVQEVSLLRDLTPAEPLAEVVAPPTLDSPKFQHRRPERPRYPRATRSSTPRPTPSSGDRADTSLGCADGHVEAGPPSPARLVYGCARKSSPAVVRIYTSVPRTTSRGDSSVHEEQDQERHEDRDRGKEAPVISHLPHPDDRGPEFMRIRRSTPAQRPLEHRCST